MTRSQAVAAAILVTQAIVAFLLSQADVTIPPLLHLALGAASVGLTSLALVLKISPPPPTLTVPGGAGPITGEKP